MSDTEVALCPDCGKEIEAEGERCGICADKYVTCDICDESVLEENTTSYNGKIYCQRCAEDNLSSCETCNGLFDINIGTGWGGMCPSCSDEHFVCEGCRETYHDDDYGGDGLCRDCIASEEEKSEWIRDYHDSPVSVFHPPGKTLYFGVELETDDYDDRNAAAEELYNLSEEEKLFYLEEDGSLGCGIEIISQPCSLNYHKYTFPWEEIAKIARRHGGKSHDTHTCGLHIHFSRETFGQKKDKLCQIRLIYFFERFWTEMVQFSRREGHWEHTADRYHIPIYDKPAREKISDIHSKFYRYQAVNIVNDDTIEIRIFRGSLKVSTILASLELVDFLIALVKKTSNQALQTMTWKEVIKEVKRSKYIYLFNYLKEIELEGGENVPDSREA